jgi:hypothetical protein
MAHATVTVCVTIADEPPVQDSVEDAVARALAPFDMADDPDGRWDWWRIDGGATKRGLPSARAGSTTPGSWWWPSGRSIGARPM